MTATLLVAIVAGYLATGALVVAIWNFFEPWDDGAELSFAMMFAGLFWPFSALALAARAARLAGIARRARREEAKRLAAADAAEVELLLRSSR
jgi:hypothetical protein